MRHRPALHACLMLAGCVSAAPALAQLRVVPEQPESAASARSGVDVFLINDGASALPGVAPEPIEVIARDGARLRLVPVARPPASVAPGTFARVRYLSAGVIEVGAPPAAPAAVPLPPRDTIVDTPPPPAAPLPPPPGMQTTPLPPSSAEPAATPPPRATETTVPGANGGASGFLDRFLPYEPIYGVFGGGSAGARLQVSFAIQPFGDDGALSHFRFAWTQSMFWAIEQPSGPFRATTYSPEAFVDIPLAPNLRLAAGYRHDSNGEGQRTSIDVNRLYVGVAKSFDLGDRWRAELAPQAWVYVGKRGVGGAIPDYWGYTGLKASIAQADGVKLAMTARGNPGTGRGSAEFFASYPLTRLGADFGVYLFGQAFTGFGEALDDFRVRESHARLGIALTR